MVLTDGLHASAPEVHIVREVEGTLITELPRHRQLVLQVAPL
jgi:hypothetical protein